MIIDFSQSTAIEFTTDICIIGSGATGFSCALTLLDSGLKVLIIEGGLKNYDQRASDLQKAYVTAHPHGGVHDARERLVGGTTTKWGGQALPFMKEDFDTRAHVPLSGWPINLNDLMDYYKKVESILGTDVTIPYDYKPWKDWKISEPKFEDNTIHFFVTKWCKIPNLAIQHLSKIEQSDNVSLLLNANVVELIPSSTLDRVKSLVIKSLNKKEAIVNAKYIIAAGGAIETVRLFLASKAFGDKGLGNQNGLVGLYFQDHVACVVGEIRPRSRPFFQELFDPFYNSGFKYFPRLKLDPSIALEKHILHASAQVVFTESGSNILSITKFIIKELKSKRLPSRKYVKILLNPLEIISVLKAAIRWKIGKRGSSPKSGPIWLEIHSEQNPEASSYVALSDTNDDLGMPRLKLHWTISELTKKTIQEMAYQVKDGLEKAAIADVILDPWIQQNTDSLSEKWFKDVYHQAGGLRMATNASEGVVDTDCKVFGIDNLYVASSAVFPTSSFSNPTMTAMALSTRISEHLIERIQLNNSFL